MDHRDHVGLLRAGVLATAEAADAPDGPASPRPRWLELGAGEGAFTLALADLLGPGATIVAVDRETRSLARLATELTERFPGTTLETRRADFRETIPSGPFDGVLAANSLHFVDDPVPVLRRVASVLPRGGRLIVVEYDADRGNPWVPHPFSAARFPTIATAAGFTGAREIGRVPSRFLDAIYAMAADRGPDQSISTETS